MTIDLQRLTAGLPVLWSSYLRDWDRTLRAANHPLQAEAEADLAKLFATEVSFHVDAPPAPIRPAPPSGVFSDDEPPPDAGDPRSDPSPNAGSAR